MGLRSGVAVALVASALLGLTVAVPQDARLGASGSGFHFLSGKGANVGDAHLVHPNDADLGRLLDRIDGRGLDPNLVKNLDRAALADLLSQMTPDQLAALGLTREQAAGMVDALRDPSLKVEALAALVGELADRGLSFLNANGDGRFNGGEQAFADLDGDGKVSEGDVRMGVLAVLASQDRGLDPAARNLLAEYEAAGGVGLDTPFGARDRANATAATAQLARSAAYPSDRAGGPLQPVCVQVYSPSLTCHQRTFVLGGVLATGDYYAFTPASPDTWTPLAVEPNAPGPQSTGTLHLDLDPNGWTPVPALTPADRLVSVAGPSIELMRDGNGMVWARGPGGEAVVTLTWAVDMGYYDLAVPASATQGDVPAALQPALGAHEQTVGLRIAEAAGADGRSYAASLRALAGYIHGFGVGVLPDRDQDSDDLLATMDAQIGCARQRSEAFVLGAQALGIPARLVVNEAHAFAEAYVPQMGWRMVDLGGCGQYQVATRANHDEVLVRQDLPFAAGQKPPSQAGAPTGPATATAIDITQSPSKLRKGSAFTIAGTVASPAGSVPAGIPITFTYNRTKTAPGTAFCSTRTSGDGHYAATCELGPDTPGGSLQLVARLAPSLANGEPTAPSYSDPPLTFQKGARLAVEGPARTAADTPLAYLARLTDEDGLPVPYAVVSVRLDGGIGQAQVTDRDGRALFTVKAAAGTHALAAWFEGDDGHDPANATLRLYATAAKLTAAVDPVALDQGKLAVSGLVGGGASQPVTATWRGAGNASEQRSALADGSGAYRILFAGAPPAGIGLVTVTLPDGTGVATGFTHTVTAVAFVSAPPRWQAGAAVPLTIRLSGLTELPLTVVADGEDVAHATVRPDEPATVLVDLAPGDHVLAVRPEPGVQLSSGKPEVRVGSFAALLDPIPALTPGSRLAVNGTLLFEGAPVQHGLSLRVQGAKAQGASGADGRFHLALDLPADLPVGRAAGLLEASDLGLQQEVELHLQRAARLDLDIPALSFHAFGRTPVTVRGEGALRVRVDGDLVNASALSSVASGTFLLRTVHVEVVSTPSADGVAPAAASRDILVVNPLTLLGVPAVAIGGTVTGVRLQRSRREALERRHRFLPPPQRIKARLLEPDLPPAVPRVVDPAEDAVLALRMRRRGGWSVRDGRGVTLPAEVDGRTVRIQVADLAPGLHDLRLDRGRSTVVVPVAVQPLRLALDDATRHLQRRLDGSLGFVTMEGLQDALAVAGADPAHAQEVRAAAEHGLYAGPRCDRAGFHAFFAALDRAQAGA